MNMRLDEQARHYLARNYFYDAWRPDSNTIASLARSISFARLTYFEQVILISFPRRDGRQSKRRRCGDETFFSNSAFSNHFQWDFEPSFRRFSAGTKIVSCCYLCSNYSCHYKQKEGLITRKEILSLFFLFMVTPRIILVAERQLSQSFISII